MDLLKVLTGGFIGGGAIFVGIRLFLRYVQQYSQGFEHIQALVSWK
ncbi:MAG TPA: hypothetical protein VKX17_22945 [Planctomycetota bacterium]|nr:hypothetical protein [Planctomycetota bacterium]